MAQYLHKLNSVEEAPDKELYLLYSLRNGIYYINRTDYQAFAHYWCRQGTFEPVVMDLASSDHHCIILDLDYQGDPITSYDTSLFPLIQSTLKLLLLPHMKHFTYIIAAREGGSGLHVHLPECIIGHDDYVLLCQQLSLALRHDVPGKGTYTLDTLQNVTLPGSAKPDQKPYRAIQMTYLDEKNTFVLDLKNCPMDLQLIRLKKCFKRVKDNDGSYFRQFLFLEETQAKQHLLRFMMPVPTPFQALYKLAFATNIGNIPNESPDSEDIATFTKRPANELGYICKGKQLILAGSHFLKTFHFLRFNTFLFSRFETNNWALKKWYERSSRLSRINAHSNPIFDHLNQSLREKNVRFADDPNPIKTILEFEDGYYFLPVFYTLCNILKISSSMMIHHLRGMLDGEFTPLLNRLEKVDETHTEVTMKDFTEQTIKFCGNNMCPRFERYRDKLKQIVHDSKRIILSCTTVSDLADLVRGLQESHFPIQMLRLSNSLRKCSQFIWNSLTESWQEIVVEKEKDSHITNLWFAIRNWLQEYRKSGNFGGPEDDVVQKFNISNVMCMITSDGSFERKLVQMDRHKWFIRTSDGLLDILTGHIGSTVPELFLSDRKLGIDLSRQELNTLYNHSKHLTNLYEVITEKSFFQKYLKALFTDQTDDLFDTLYELLQEPMADLIQDKYAVSMMHFYVHLCKFSAFEHDLMMYLMDILSSIFIATNYERKFFVFKGKTSNGKSKLFEILGKVFGGYYHCIQSDNLKPSNSSNGPSPDLAATLFNCRIVTTEELEGKLNENRVKQITGNSCVTFRNMYEASQGGIPTAKLFTTTNNIPDCKSSDAFQDRVVAIPFMSRFVNKAPTTTKEQVRLNQYSKDEYVIEQAYMGCFLMLSYHLQKCMNEKDGLLHSRDPPPSVVEYTHLYLLNTNVYNQFKTHMDVQIGTECCTTMTDLRSAVRQFLKGTKNNTTPETDIILKFAEEFSECRRSDLQLGNMQYNSVLDQPSCTLSVVNTLLQGKKRKLDDDEDSEDECKRRKLEDDDEECKKRSSKKRKRDDDEFMAEPMKKKSKLVKDTGVYYENVVIRNLRRTYEN